MEKYMETINIKNNKIKPGLAVISNSYTELRYLEIKLNQKNKKYRVFLLNKKNHEAEWNVIHKFYNLKSAHLFFKNTLINEDVYSFVDLEGTVKDFDIVKREVFLLEDEDVIKTRKATKVAYDFLKNVEIKGDTRVFYRPKDNFKVIYCINEQTTHINLNNEQFKIGLKIYKK